MGTSAGMERDQLIETLAAVLAGLQAPLSMSGDLGVTVLGAADEPYRRILADRGFGWCDAAEFEDYLRKVLT